MSNQQIKLNPTKCEPDISICHNYDEDTEELRSISISANCGIIKVDQTEINYLIELLQEIKQSDRYVWRDGGGEIVD